MSNRIDIIKGADELIEFTLFYSDGSICDLTDCTVLFTIKKDVEDIDAEAIFTSAVTEHDDDEEGITTIAIPKESTEDIEEGNYLYDLKVIDADGLVSILRRSIITISSAITERDS